MARVIKTLEALVADVRMETGRSPNRNFGIDEYSTIAYLLQREQRRLWWDYDFRFLNVRRDIALVAGERYYDVPAGISFEKIISFRTKFGAEWIPVENGITMDNYTFFDSDNDARSSPARNWDLIDAGSGVQIEIWPIPDQDGTARLAGAGELGVFVSDDDNCTLDGTLLTLFAAAKLKPDDPNLLPAANRLLTKMIGSESRINERDAVSAKGGETNRVNIGSPKRVVVVKG